MSKRSKNLEALAALEANWDGYNAKPISPAAINRADDFWFVPMANGGIQIELNAGGMEIEIEIKPDGTIAGVYAGTP